MAQKPMTDEERNKLVEKLDRELQEFIEEKIAKNKNNPKQDFAFPGDDRPIEEILEEMKTHPAFVQEIDLSKPLHPATEALMKLKYESDSKEDNATSFKDDGNQNFKIKKYRWAIDNYSAGLKCKCANRLLNAVLFTNKAAANFHLGNYGSALTDAIFARKFKPDHMKALVRGIDCCFKLSRYGDAIKWCDSGLLINPTDEKLLELRGKADKLKRTQEKERRKEEAQQRKKDAEERKLVDSILKRGIRLKGVKSAGDAGAASHNVLSSVECHHPSGAKVYVDEKGDLNWPAMFMYPEYGETDFITAFNENTTFIDHIDHIFGVSCEPAPWDEKKKYKTEKIQVYFEETNKELLHQVDMHTSLASALKDKRFVVQGGMPAFIVLVKESPFAKHFLSKYQN